MVALNLSIYSTHQFTFENYLIWSQFDARYLAEIRINSDYSSMVETLTS